MIKELTTLPSENTKNKNSSQRKDSIVGGYMLSLNGLFGIENGGEGVLHRL